MAARKGATLDWKGPAFKRQLFDHLERGMRKAVLFVEADVKKRLSVGQPRRSTPSGRMVGLDPSRPGDPPKVLTSRLRNSIQGIARRSARGVEGAVGTGVVYGRRLELGFIGTDSRGRSVHQLPRPYLRPGVLENRKRIVRIIARG